MFHGMERPYASPPRANRQANKLNPPPERIIKGLPRRRGNEEEPTVISELEQRAAALPCRAVQDSRQTASTGNRLSSITPPLRSQPFIPRSQGTYLRLRRPCDRVVDPVENTLGA
jgi:hypothetical protein